MGLVLIPWLVHFTGKLLPEFIYEDMEMTYIPKLKLLNHIKSFGHEIEDNDIDKVPS